MPGRGSDPDVGADPVPEFIVQGDAFGGDHEQHHPGVSIPFLADHEGFLHVGVLLHPAVDLGCADPHASRVQGGVRAAVDDEAPLWGSLCEVSLVPQPREEVEVGGVVAPVVGVVPEPQRLGRKGRPAHQLAAYPWSDRKTRPVDYVHVHAQHWALDLSGVNRAGRLAAYQAATQIGSAGDRG